MQFKNKNNLECYVHLMGGLGNQLFQLAAGLNHSTRHGCRLVLDESSGNIRRNYSGNADVLSFKSDKYSNIRIRAPFKVLIEKVTGRIVMLSLGSKTRSQHYFPRFLLISIQSVMLSLYFRKIIKVWTAREIGFEPIQFAKHSNYMIGYFQSYKYASELNVKSILSGLTISSQSINLYKALCRFEKPLIVHVRLGDYQNEPNFGLLSKDYYSNAILIMMKKHNFKTIHVFSDDTEAAKSFIPESYLSISRWMDGQGESSAVTFEKMRYGSGYIIGNSTFSWWSSFLSYSENPPIIAPKPWFVAMDEPNELIPPQWIRINR